MATILDQWEAEAKRQASTDDYFKLYERILVLIDLVRKKDKTLFVIASTLQSVYSEKQDRFAFKLGKDAKEALALTESLK